MGNKKHVRKKGKISLRRYFQKLIPGESVAIVRELSVQASFPKRFQGRTGIVVGKRGKSYIIEVKDMNKKKNFIIEPIHLKKIKPSK